MGDGATEWRGGGWSEREHKVNQANKAITSVVSYYLVASLPHNAALNDRYCRNAWNSR